MNNGWMDGKWDDGNQCQYDDELRTILSKRNFLAFLSLFVCFCFYAMYPISHSILLV